jgi:hypothetical protein
VELSDANSEHRGGRSARRSLRHSLDKRVAEIVPNTQPNCERYRVTPQEGRSTKQSATVKETVVDAELEISQEEAAEAGSGADLEHAKTAVLNSLTSMGSGASPT